MSEPTKMGKQPVKLDWLSTDPVQPEGICIDSSYGLTCVIGVCPVEHGLVTMSPQHTWQLRPQPGSAFYSAADICTPSIQQLGWTSITERHVHILVLTFVDLSHDVFLLPKHPMWSPLELRCLAHVLVP